MARKDWQYLNAATCQSGLMHCSACGKEIAAGEYKCRDAGEYYVTIHRACSSDDANWKRLDAEASIRLKRYEEFVAACVEFQAKWGIDDLNVYLPEEMLPKQSFWLTDRVSLASKETGR